MLFYEYVTTEEGMKLAHEAGLDSLPGGGAEIFHPDIRTVICAIKKEKKQAQIKYFFKHLTFRFQRIHN